MSLDRYEIRRFDPELDIAGAVRCFESSFRHICWPLIDYAEPRVIEDLFRSAAASGAPGFVAVVDGEARGVLMGGFPFEPKYVARETAHLGSWASRIFARRYRSRPLARAYLRRLLIGYARHFILHPPTVATMTMLLASQAEYRGGIGRAMMDAWVEHGRSVGYKRTTVCTDSKLSWDFYQRYGFTRVRDFNLTAYYYSLPGDDVRGYIYSLDI